MSLICNDFDWNQLIFTDAAGSGYHTWLLAEGQIANTYSICFWNKLCLTVLLLLPWIGKVHSVVPPGSPRTRSAWLSKDHSTQVIWTAKTQRAPNPEIQKSRNPRNHCLAQVLHSFKKYVTYPKATNQKLPTLENLNPETEHLERSRTPLIRRSGNAEIQTPETPNLQIQHSEVPNPAIPRPKPISAKI